jgi:hypothetical protein
MKIYIINPPSDFLINSKCLIPTSPLYIYSMLKYHNYDVSIVDLAGLSEADWNIPTDGDIYGISATTPQFATACRLAETIKTSSNILVLGGAHGTILPRESLADSKFDIVCLREGEQTMLEIVQGRELKDILGIAYRDSHGSIFINSHRVPANIDSLPHIVLDGIDHKSYVLHIFTTKGNPIVRGFPILTSRGCPFNCLSGETLINTIEGKIKIKDLVGRDIKVLTRNPQTNKPEFAQATNISKTRENAELVRVTFDDGTYIDCTPDHKFKA